MSTKVPKAMRTALLPQYFGSEAAMERLIDALHGDGGELARTANVQGTTKLTTEAELRADGLGYFFDDKTKMENEFLDDLSEEIGGKKAKAFCDAIANGWFGKNRRKSKRVLGVKRAVRNHLKRHLPKGAALETLLQNPDLAAGRASLTSTDLAKILTINDRMLIKHKEIWKDRHPNSTFVNDDAIWLRRGLGLRALYPAGERYREWDYINAYSWAVSAPEQFAQIDEGAIPALVSGDLGLFAGRILFFSPFVPGMTADQLEFGVIPAVNPPIITDRGEHGGLREYVLGEQPEEVDIDALDLEEED